MCQKNSKATAGKSNSCSGRNEMSKNCSSSESGSSSGKSVNVDYRHAIDTLISTRLQGNRSQWLKGG